MQPSPNIPATGLARKLLNTLAAPGEVFDEIAVAPCQSVHWRLPTLLVCLVGLAFSLHPAAHAPELASELPAAQAQFFAGALPLVTSLGICLAAFGGLLWSAFVLWFIGNVLLRTSFSYRKALEIAGMASIILVLGTIVTGLLISVTADPHSRPSLALFVHGSSSSSKLHRLLDTFNVFYLWTAFTLAVGLSRLTGVAFKEAGFWIFSY